MAVFDHELEIEVHLYACRDSRLVRRIDAAKIKLPQGDAQRLFRRLKGDVERIWRASS